MREQIKLNASMRNQPCPCESGEKFKKCCWNLAVSQDWGAISDKMKKREDKKRGKCQIENELRPA